MNSSAAALSPAIVTTVSNAPALTDMLQEGIYLLFLLRNEFTTGTTVDVDGGALLP